MKTVLLTIIFVSFAICASAQKQVYVCTGDGAYRYHYYSDCSGLGNCRATIVKKSLEEAKKMPNIKGLCKKCSNRASVAMNDQTITEQERKDSCYTCMLERKQEKEKMNLAFKQ